MSIRKEENPEILNDYDETIAFLGHWGCFQKTVFFLLCASTIPNGTGVLSIIFVADIPAHHCRIPEVNLTQDWLNVVIPTKVKCQKTVAVWNAGQRYCSLVVKHC